MEIAPDGPEVAETREVLAGSGYWMDEPRQLAPTSVYDFPWSISLGRGAWSATVYGETLSQALEEAKGKATRHRNTASSST